MGLFFPSWKRAVNNEYFLLASRCFYEYLLPTIFCFQYIKIKNIYYSICYIEKLFGTLLAISKVTDASQSGHTGVAMKVVLIASMLGLLLLVTACSLHQGYYGSGHYGGGHCRSYWNSSVSAESPGGASDMSAAASAFGY